MDTIESQIPSSYFMHESLKDICQPFYSLPPCTRGKLISDIWELFYKITGEYGDFVASGDFCFLVRLGQQAKRSVRSLVRSGSHAAEFLKQLSSYYNQSFRLNTDAWNWNR